MNIEEKVKVLAEQLELLKSICLDSTCTLCRVRNVCMKITGVPDTWDSNLIKEFARDVMSITKEGDQNEINGNEG